MADTEEKARKAATIKRDRGPESRAMYTVWLPEGWCFEPGLHSAVEPTRADAERIRDSDPIQRCEKDCDCHV